MRVQDTALVHETKKIPSLVQVLPETARRKRDETLGPSTTYGEALLSVPLTHHGNLPPHGWTY